MRDELTDEQLSTCVGGGAEFLVFMPSIIELLMRIFAPRKAAAMKAARLASRGQ